MTITTETVNEIGSNLETFYPCGENTITLRSSPRVVTTIADNPKQSRTRPSGNLWMSPTVQAKQYTKTILYGISRQGLYKSGTQVCDGVSRDILQYKYRSFANSTMVGSNGPETNWELKVRQAINDRYVNLGVNLAEYRQTSNMFKKFATKTVDAWKLFKGKSSSRRKLSPCDVAAAELMASYGVMPLLSDLEASVRTLQEKLEDPLYQRISVFSKERTNFSSSGREGYWEASDRTIVYVEFEPDKGDFTLGNAASLAWEVVPYSFVADWVIPIGDYLSALDALVGVKSIKGTRTRKQRYFHKTMSPITSYVTLRPSFVKYKSHERFVLTTIPLPRVPRWDPSKSFIAIRHGISLLTQLSAPCKNRGK